MVEHPDADDISARNLCRLRLIFLIGLSIMLGAHGRNSEGRLWIDKEQWMSEERRVEVGEMPQYEDVMKVMARVLRVYELEVVKGEVPPLCELLDEEPDLCEPSLHRVREMLTRMSPRAAWDLYCALQRVMQHEIEQER